MLGYACVQITHNQYLKVNSLKRRFITEHFVDEANQYQFVIITTLTDYKLN